MTNYYTILRNTLRGFSDASRQEAMRRRDEWARAFSFDVGNYIVSGALTQFIGPELLTKEEELDAVRQALDMADEVYKVYDIADYDGRGWSHEEIDGYVVVDC
jgi:hypothetical protein